MREAQGNLWDWYDKGEWICITTNGMVKTNGALVMGRGCAREAANRLTELPHILGRMVTEKGNHVLHADSLRIVSFPVKHDWRESADLSLIERSARELMALMDYWSDPMHPNSVYLPRPGCGNGNLDWEHVKIPLHDILDDRVTVVTYA